MREVNEINQAKMDIAGVEGTLDMLSKCDWRTKEEMQVTMARMAKELQQARESINENLVKIKVANLK